MVRFKLDPEIMGLSSVFECEAKVAVKDCFRDDETIFYIVGEGEAGRAIGKGGMHVKQIQEKLGKRIRIIEYHENVEQFVRNVIAPLQVEQVRLREGVVIIADSSRKTKSLLMGRESKNLELLQRAVRRFFSVDVKFELLTR